MLVVCLECRYLIGLDQISVGCYGTSTIPGPLAEGVFRARLIFLSTRRPIILYSERLWHGASRPPDVYGMVEIATAFCTCVMIDH